MKRPVIIGLLVLAVLATATHVGFGLTGALRQVGALVSRDTHAVASAAVPIAPLAEDGAVLNPLQNAAAQRTAQNAEPLVPEDEPQVVFDTEGAVRAAGERDPNVAELLDDPDLAISNAVRDFVTHLDLPGTSGADR